MSTCYPKPKALLLTPTLDTIGGVESHYNALELHRHDDRIDYFFVTAGREETALAMVYRLFRNYLRFWMKIADARYGLVLLNPSLNPNSFYRDAIFCWLALRRRKRVLVFFHGWLDQLESQILRRSVAKWVFHCSFQRVQNFVVLGASFRDKLIRMGCSAKSRFWMETTAADTSYLPDFSIRMRMCERDSLRILFLSRIVASKGADIAIRAFQLACARLPHRSMELVIAGDGPDLEKLKSQVRRESIEGIRFLGPVTGAQKKQVIFDADMLLFPTMHDEGMPVVILEAMLYGLPILSRSVAAIPDVVEHMKNGFLTDQCDADVFADWIVTLGTNPDLRRQMSIANHEKALRLYASDVVRGRLLRILDEILEE